ncbi:MAG TPA: ribosome-associated translation inhibitor RaiA [Candidatus Paceibacterota bacterium]|nr:ribosome-associated translation inhibitor RaiA [Candidatus Paceibacterota bacterium]HRZ34473.1 ribosome-associated translation inhibitor RaiA [Candidatus Paceibacterota bacterium]
MESIKTNIKATNFELTPEVRSHVENKIHSIAKYFNIKEDTEILAHVEIDKVAGEHHKHGNIFRAEINLTYEGKTYRAEETREDIFVAIEEAGREISYEIKKGKKRHIGLVRRGGAALKRLLRFGQKDESES